MKSNYLCPFALLAAMLFTACDSDNENALRPEVTQPGNTVTFTLQSPGGENVFYGRSVHDADEYAINTLALYEYEVNDDGTTTLCRIMKKDGNGRNSLELTQNPDLSYTFSIIVPAENDGRKFSYRFVANDATADPAPGTDFNRAATDDAVPFAATNARIAITDDNQSADTLASPLRGIAMTGVAKVGDSEVITMSKDIKCEVVMTRIVSRIDIRYQTPNLMVTGVTLTGAPERGRLFPSATLDEITEESGFHTLAINANTPMPTAFPEETEGYRTGDAFEMKKAFYVYERQNTADNHLTVHIDYVVSANGRKDYKGSVDVPFCKTDGSGEYVDNLRNHLYTIVLGNGTDPVSGKVKASLTVNEWTGSDIDEPLTDDDTVIED